MNTPRESRPDSAKPIGEYDTQQDRGLNEREPGHQNSEQKRDEERLRLDRIGQRREPRRA